MGDPEQLAGGELNAAVTSALVGIHNRYLGRGPKTASTFHYGNVLVTLMQRGTDARGEVPHPDRPGRCGQQHPPPFPADDGDRDFREAVERLTGRKVLAFISGNHIDPDIAAELFILDGPL